MGRERCWVPGSRARFTKLPFLLTQKRAQGSWFHYCPPVMVMGGSGLSSPNNNVRDFQNPLWSGTPIPAPYSGSFFPMVSRIPIRDKVLSSGFSKRCC